MNQDMDITKPTKKQVLIPLIILLITLAIGGALLLVAKKIGSHEEPETIFYAPGVQTISVSEPGEYTIDVAIETTYEGKTYILPEDFTGIKGELTVNSKPVELSGVISSVYGKEGEKGKTLFTFMAEESGEYILTTALEHMTVQEAVLVARRADSKNGVIIILATCAILLILMGICQFIGYGAYHFIRWVIFVLRNKRSL